MFPLRNTETVVPLAMCKVVSFSRFLHFHKNTDRHDGADTQRTMHCMNGIVSLNKGRLSGTRNSMSTLRLLGSENADSIIVNDRLKHTKTNCMMFKMTVCWYIYLYMYS